MGIHTLALIALSKAGFGVTPLGDREVVRVLAEPFSLNREVVLAILCGEVDTWCEGHDVVIE